MLYLIGLGLNEKSISQEGIEVIKNCKRIYLENYTVNFPYPIKKLEKIIGKKINLVDRNFVEQGMDKLINEAKKLNVALLVYGSPLTATTHISLIQETKKQKLKCEIIYNASILDAIAETGLQLYKFGKITSMPNFEAESFIDVIKDNRKIDAHSLILADIGLEFISALERLEKIMKKERINVGKIIICERLGTKSSKIYYSDINNLKLKDIKSPYCIIIPGKLHFIEEEVLKTHKI